MIRKLALSLAAALLPLSAAAAAEPPSGEPAATPRTLGEEASIVFPSDSTIRNFKADRDRGVWIEDRRGNWYYGTFMGICRDIDFAHAIDIETRGTSRLDRFAAILVRGEKCPLSSFVTSAPPPSKKDKEAEKAAAEATKDAEAN